MDIYFSPHPDDAVLSCGGRLVSTDQSLVVNVFAGDYSGLTKWDKLCGIKNNPMDQRRREDKEILSSLGVDVINLDFLDIAVYENLRSDSRSDDVKTGITKKIKNIIEKYKPKRLFFPMGVKHADHRLLNSVGKKIKGKMFFYQDIPYSLGFDSEGCDEFEFNEDIMNCKIDSILQYKTQIKGFLNLTDSDSITELKSKLIDHHQKDDIYVEKFIEK